jgi:hypothetical protein
LDDTDITVDDITLTARKYLVRARLAVIGVSYGPNHTHNHPYNIENTMMQEDHNSNVNNDQRLEIQSLLKELDDMRSALRTAHAAAAARRDMSDDEIEADSIRHYFQSLPSYQIAFWAFMIASMIVWFYYDVCTPNTNQTNDNNDNDVSTQTSSSAAAATRPNPSTAWSSPSGPPLPPRPSSLSSSSPTSSPSSSSSKESKRS